MLVRRLFDLIAAAYRRLNAAGSALQSPFLLAVRLYWGWQFAQTGWGKLQHLSKVTDFFTSLGIPAPGINAVAVSWMEFVGGIMLAVGFGSRFFGLILAFDMVVAYLTASREALFSIFSDPGKFYADDAYTFLFASLLILIFGPGKLSLDELAGRFSFGSIPSPKTTAPVPHLGNHSKPAKDNRLKSGQTRS